MFNNILIATDGSELSAKAVDNGVVLARTFRARITGVHVVQFLYVAPGGGGHTTLSDSLQAQIREGALSDGNRYLDDIQKAATAAGVPFERVLVENEPPWRAIVETAQEKGCDLIVMAAHGRRGIAALVVGSETHKVLTHAKIPVLVYR